MDDQVAKPTLDIEDIVDAKGRVLNQEPVWDKMLIAEIAINRETPGAMVHSKGIVKRRAVTPSDNTTGTYDSNPLLNTLVYEVEFEDGDIVEYSANVIAENILTQVDSEGFSETMLEGIIDHKREMLLK
jgi:hypothetical protein